jgi:hypothetical protein
VVILTSNVRALCVACGEVVSVYKFFDQGKACRKCVESAATITAVYTIFGRRYTETLKSQPAPRLEIVKSAPGAA